MLRGNFGSELTQKFFGRQVISGTYIQGVSIYYDPPLEQNNEILQKFRRDIRNPRENVLLVIRYQTEQKWAEILITHRYRTVQGQMGRS